jgi:hypothetical protein
MTRGAATRERGQRRGEEKRNAVMTTAPRRSSACFLLETHPRLPDLFAAHMTLLDPARNSYRFVILAFNCLLTLGSYYAFDMPSVLQNELVSQVITPFSPNGAQTLYNAWYTAYAWCNLFWGGFAGPPPPPPLHHRPRQRCRLPAASTASCPSSHICLQAS